MTASNRERAGPGPASAEMTSVRFAALARRLSETARASGLDVPAFRSPPKGPGVRRSIRRSRDGSATVAVALRNRPTVAVVGDLIDGIIVAAGLDGPAASAARDELWGAVAPLLEGEADPASLGNRLAA